MEILIEMIRGILCANPILTSRSNSRPCSVEVLLVPRKP